VFATHNEANLALFPPLFFILLIFISIYYRFNMRHLVALSWLTNKSCFSLAACDRVHVHLDEAKLPLLVLISPLFLHTRHGDRRYNTFTIAPRLFFVVFQSRFHLFLFDLNCIPSTHHFRSFFDGTIHN
jgi:hypothetical protein